MPDTNTILANQEPTLVIEDEVVFLDSLKELEALPKQLPMKMDYNAIVHCRQGRVLLELGGNQQVLVQAGQLLLVPARKLLQPMMVSTDVEAGALLLTDRMLKSVLGSQIDIWNRAMYMHEIYVISTQQGTKHLHEQTRSLFKDNNMLLFREIAFSFLRTFLLLICEELLHHSEAIQMANEASTVREKTLFNQFLELLSHEEQKRQQVSYYADRLCITPKYLSTVCRNVSGKSPMRWITDSVMEDGYSLLRNTELTVKEISNRLGFPNSSFFGQYFREQASMTPVEYRNRYKKRH
jgi:AraC-like DNA-binding protein